jgi:hypothetical protein
MNVRSFEQLETRHALHGATLFDAQLAGSRADALHCLSDLCSLVPVHADNPEQRAEHEYLFSLFPTEAADGVTRIVVPAGETLIVDQCLSAEWIRVQGTLDIRPGAEIRVDTIVTDPTSTLNVTGGTVTFVDGPLRSEDPLQISRGLIAHGTVNIHGTAKTPFADLTGQADAGDSVLGFATEGFFGWQVGDQLVIPGTHQTLVQDDERTIAAIDGTTITLDRPLSFDHPTLLDHPPVVANLTRSVVFQSENPAGVRGHVMFMHNASRVEISYATFSDLGRTKAEVVVTDPLIDGSGGDNPRGRYSLHFHRGGAASNPGSVAGVVVHGAKKLGIVNHASNVEVADSIAYRFDGSGLFSEAGNELGAFNDNLAIRSTKPGDSSQEVQLVNRRNAFDFGHSGVAYWLQGGGVEMHGNAFYGVNTGVFVFPGQVGVENGQSVRLRRDDLPVPDPTAPETFGPAAFPITIHDTFGAGSNAGIVTYHGGSQGPPYGRFNEIHDFDVVNVNRAISLNYTVGTDVQRVRAIGNIAHPAGIAFAGNGVEGLASYTDVSAEGFLVGFRPPYIAAGFGGYELSVTRAYLNNVVGVASLSPNRYLATPIRSIYTDITFGILPASSLPGTGYYDWPQLLPAGVQYDFWQEVL